MITSVNSWMWFLTRSTGIVAAVLAVLSLVLGLAFSGRFTRGAKPNWWLSMHNWLGGMTLGFIGAHLLVAFLDSDTGLRLIDLVLPSTTAGWAIGWGVVAMWIFAAVTLTSPNRIRRRLPRRLWHMLHLLSIPAVVLTGVHTYQTGSDMTGKLFAAGFALLAGAAVYPMVVRFATRKQRRRPTRSLPVSTH